MDAAQTLSRVDWGATLEMIGVTAFVFDRHGELVFLNRQGYGLLGFGSFAEAADESAGRTHRLRVVTMQGTPLKGGPPSFVHRALAGETVVEDFMRVVRCDGRSQVIVRATISPLLDRNADVIGAICFVRDATVEYELAQRKREFVRVTTHELRTPTTALRLHAQRLLRSEPPIPSVCACATAIDRATRRIETLVVRLHDIATASAGEPIPIQPSTFRLDTLVADVVESLQPEQSARVHTRASPAEVCADPTRMREVIESLLDNAFRYSEAATSVTVDVAERDGRVELSVADHGVGIPDAKQHNVFESFFRAHVDTPIDRGGLGTSLYLADQIMKRHGGRIWFESHERQGSTFHLALGGRQPVAGQSVAAQVGASP